MRHLLATSTVVALLVTSGGAVTAQEASPEPAASPTPEQLAAAEERLASASCFGKPATMVAIAGFETLGTPGADVIVGTEGDDIIRGEGGNDRICTGAGADLVEGGDGKDRIAGGAGDDMLEGGDGNDTIAGGTGADMVTGAAGNDRLSGNAGDDTLDGGMGNDVCKGGKGSDWLPGCNDKRRTKGKLVTRKSITLQGPHRGSIVIDEVDKVTLDCAGHTVTGPGGGVGIALEWTKGVTVKNCDVSNFNVGINVMYSHRNTLANNRAHGNSQIGILVTGNNNKLISNVADDNGFERQATYGFWLQGNSSGNVLKRNSASGNGWANFALGGSRNTLIGNTSTGSHEGFSVSGERQTLEGNSATGAREHGIGSNEPASKSVFRDNVVTGTPGPAFFLAGFGNTITGNAADHNEIGFQDESVPGANSYTDNTCIGWTERSSQPEGLCDDTIPVEPEPATQASDSADAEGEPTAEE